MAGTIKIQSFSGQTLYCHIRNMSGAVWDGGSFASYNSSNWASYKIALTEDTGSSYYKATFPASIAEGFYEIVAYQQVGGAAATGDTIAGTRFFDWDGVNERNGVYNALVEARLDELIEVSAGGTAPAASSLLDLIMNKNSSQTFDRTTDSLEGQADSGGGLSAAAIADAIWDEILDGSHATAGSAGERLQAIDNKLPSGNLSSFDPATTGVNLNSDQSSATVGTVNALGTTARSHVNSELLDVLNVDTLADLSAGAPPSTPTVLQVLRWIYAAIIFKRTATASEEAIFNSAGTKVSKATVSNDGTTATKEKYGAPS